MIKRQPLESGKNKLKLQSRHQYNLLSLPVGCRRQEQLSIYKHIHLYCPYQSVKIQRLVKHLEQKISKHAVRALHASVTRKLTTKMLKFMIRKVLKLLMEGVAYC